MNLPPPRYGAPYRVAVVCLGNICRSPMAAVVLEDRLRAAGLAGADGDPAGGRVGAVEVVSGGTGDWHVGDPMDDRAAALLTRHGYDPTRHRARQFGAASYDTCDLVLAMDAQNHRDLLGWGPADRLRMFRDFDPVPGGAGRDVPDPYYGGADGFEEVLSMVERTADALVATLGAALGPAVGSPPGGGARDEVTGG